MVVNGTERKFSYAESLVHVKKLYLVGKCTVIKMARIVQLKLKEEVDPVFKIVRDSWKLPNQGCKPYNKSYIWFVGAKNTRAAPFRDFDESKIIDDKFRNDGFYKVYIRKTFCELFFYLIFIEEINDLSINISNVSFYY